MAGILQQLAQVSRNKGQSVTYAGTNDQSFTSVLWHLCWRDRRSLVSKWTQEATAHAAACQKEDVANRGSYRSAKLALGCF